MLPTFSASSVPIGTSATSSPSATSVPNPFANPPANPLAALNPAAAANTQTQQPTGAQSNVPAPFGQGPLPALPANPFAPVANQPNAAASNSQPSNATNTNSSSSSSSDDVAYTSQLVEVSSSAASGGSRQYLLSLLVPASSGVKFAILHYYTQSDLRQTNVYMNLTSSSALVSQLLSAASASPSGVVGAPLSAQTAYFVFVHGPITLADSDELSYSFTYATRADGTGARNTPLQRYSRSSAAAAVASVAVPDDAKSALPGLSLGDATTAAGSASASASSSIDVNSPWNGQFQADAACIPSDSCCCGVGLLNVSTTLADPSQVLLSGGLDGGAGCLYQTSLTGLMQVDSSQPLSASRRIEIPNADKTQIVFSAALSAGADGQPNTILTVSNSFRPCQTVATKIAPLHPQSSESDDGSISSGPTTLATDPSTAAALDRDAFIGSYDFDSSCVPSASCCCAQGPLVIEPVLADTQLPELPPAAAALASQAAASAAAATAAADRSRLVIFRATLDGGSACMGMQSVAQAFNVSSPTSAAFAVPPVLTMSADLSSSDGSTQYDTLSFKNNIYPTCISKAVKKPTPTTQSNSDSSTQPSAPSTPQQSPDPTQPAPVALTEAEFAAVRQTLVGEYDATGCVPSSSCCCASGVTRVTANSTAPNRVDVDTHLVGVGFSCLQQDGPLRLTFTLLNRTSAEAAPFAQADAVKFWATRSADKNDSIVVSNSLHNTCPTVSSKAHTAGRD